MRQKMLSEELKGKYGVKVYKLSLSSGCTCPNRDGTIMYGGCTFCSEGGSGESAAPFVPLREQIEFARKKVEAKLPKAGQDKRLYIAYFQSFTNTYGDPERLYEMFREAAMLPEIAAVSIGTRPDCLEAPVMEMLCRLQEIKPVWVELGLQTMHDRTAERVHRGYCLETFENAYKRLKEAGMEVVVHVIMGLPGESRCDMLDTIRYLSSLRPVPDGIKIAQLQILRGTALGVEYQKDPFPVMTLEEYCELIRDCLAILPEEVVIHRLTGDGPKNLLIEPAWSADKKRVLNTMRRYLTQPAFSSSGTEHREVHS